MYLACEFLRRSRGGSQHQSVALNLTSLLHQGSPGTCRWHSGCCLYKADTQLKQEPVTHLVPNFSSKRLVRLYRGYFALKSFSSLTLDLNGTVSLQNQERLEAPVDL